MEHFIPRPISFHSAIIYHNYIHDLAAYKYNLYKFETLTRITYVCPLLPILNAMYTRINI